VSQIRPLADNSIRLLTYLLRITLVLIQSVKAGVMQAVAKSRGEGRGGVKLYTFSWNKGVTGA